MLLTGQESDSRGRLRERWSGCGSEVSEIVVEELRPENADRQMDEALEGAELIVDAVVGTGFKPPLRRGCGDSAG